MTKKQREEFFEFALTYDALPVIAVKVRKNKFAPQGVQLINLMDEFISKT
jgi:hypothetical protein